MFTALLEYVLREEEADMCGFEPGEREIVLEVLVSNIRAMALYRQLGFVEQPRRSPRS